MSALAILGSGMRFGLVLMLAAMSWLMATRAGILFIAIEGAMVLSAFFGVYAAYATGSPWLGEAAAVVTGAAYCLAVGAVSAQARSRQVVFGIGANLFATGLASGLSSMLMNTHNVSLSIARLPEIQLPLLGGAPVNLLVAAACMALAYGLMYCTRAGLRIMAAGENPDVAKDLGVAAYRYQLLAMAVAGVFAGLAGAEVTLGQLGYFSRGITGGRVWVAFAVMLVGRLRIRGIAAAALLVGMVDAFQLRAQAMYDIPGQFLRLLPYAVTLLAMAVRPRRTAVDIRALLKKG